MASAATATNGSTAASGAPAMDLIKQSQLISKLNELPTVSQSFNYIFNIYGQTKERNNLIKQALEMGETAFLTSLLLANDVAEKTGVKNLMEKPARYVDTTAANAVGVVEEKVPQIKSTPQELLDSTKSYYTTTRDNVVKATSDRVEQARSLITDTANSGINTISSYAPISVVQETFNKGLESVDHYVDVYLPDEEAGEKEAAASEANQETLGKAMALGGKVGHRLLNRLGSLAQQGKSSVIVILPNWRDSNFVTSLQTMVQDFGARIGPLTAEENLSPKVAEALKPFRERLSATGAMLLSVVPQDTVDTVSDMSKKLYNQVTNIHILGGTLPSLETETNASPEDKPTAPEELKDLSQQKPKQRKHNKQQHHQKQKQHQQQKIEESNRLLGVE